MENVMYQLRAEVPQKRRHCYGFKLLALLYAVKVKPELETAIMPLSFFGITYISLNISGSPGIYQRGSTRGSGVSVESKVESEVTQDD